MCRVESRPILWHPEFLLTIFNLGNYPLVIVEEGYIIQAVINNATRMIDSVTTTCQISDANRYISGVRVGE